MVHLKEEEVNNLRACLEREQENKDNAMVELEEVKKKYEA